MYPKNKVCFVSVDVEYDVGTQDAKTFRGVEEMDKLFGIFETRNIRATLFVTGDVLSRFQDRVRAWAKKYEIASHSYSHQYFHEISEGEKEDDIKKFVALYQEMFGEKPKGFRAPSHVIDGATLRILDQYGFRYDSSVVPHYPLFKKYRGYQGRAPSEPYIPSLSFPRKRESTCGERSRTRVSCPDRLTLDSRFRGNDNGKKLLEIPVAGQLLGIPLAGAWIRGLPIGLYKTLFLLHKPDFITLSTHSWDGVIDKRFYKKLENIIILLKNSGYIFRSGKQIADDYISKNRRP